MPIQNFIKRLLCFPLSGQLEPSSSSQEFSQEKAALGHLFQQLPQENLRTIVSFAQTNWDEGTNLALISHSFKDIIDSSEERQIAQVFKRVKAKTTHLYQLKLPKNYLETLSFEKLKALLPPKFELETAFLSLLTHGSSIVPKSDEERLALYLMKHIPWNLTKNLQQKWPINSEIELLLTSLDHAFKEEKLDQIDWKICSPYGLTAYQQDYNLFSSKMKIPSYNAAKSFVLEVVRFEGTLLEFADSSLKNDREVVLEAVRNTGVAIFYASDELKNDKEIVLIAMKSHGHGLCVVSEDLQKDREVVLEAVKNDGEALFFADDALKSDREIVLIAVTTHGSALSVVSENLKKDPEIALEAVKSDETALFHLPDELKANEKIVLKAVKKNGMTLQFTPLALRKNKRIVLEAVKNYGMALQFASEELKKDEDVVLQAVKCMGEALMFAHPTLRENRNIALEAVKQNWRAREYLPLHLREDKEIFQLILQKFTISGTESESLRTKNNRRH